MLLQFKVKNYRSLRDESILDMEAAGLGDQKECLLKYKNNSYPPVVSINGKNGGGKSNLIRAMWLAAQFIKNAQRTQHETAEVPVRPFELNDYSKTSRLLLNLNMKKVSGIAMVFLLRENVFARSIYTGHPRDKSLLWLIENIKIFHSL